MIAAKILVVEDDASLRRITQIQLQEAGHEVEAVSGAAEALRHLSERSVDLVLTDLKMEGMNGLELLREIRQDCPEPLVILITAFGTIENAVEAMKAGAYDYITKPLHHEELRMIVARALDNVQLRRENVNLRSQLDRKYGFESIVGSSKSLLRTLDLAARAAQSDSTILLQGETGTGKELLARAIHGNSRRRQGPFVVINCAAIPRELLESELFGHTRGAFTGAVASSKGRVELGNGGTLFLDEIGEMPIELQAKILRLVQQREIERVGAATPVSVDVRIIAATHRDLAARIEDGAFREDLYYRLAVIPIALPPLRERREDIPELTQQLFARYREKRGRPDLRLPCALLPYFRTYRWPGNVRELENVVERIVVLATGDEVQVEDLPEALQGLDGALESLQLDLPPDGIRLEAVEKELILRALERCDGNQTNAARYLDISRKTLLYRMERHGIAKDYARRD